jgi:hypothetical protein
MFGQPENDSGILKSTTGLHEWRVQILTGVGPRIRKKDNMKKVTSNSGQSHYEK